MGCCCLFAGQLPLLQRWCMHLLGPASIFKSYRPTWPNRSGPQRAGIWVVGLEGSQQAQDITQVRLDGALALVVGSEGEGMRQLVRDSCDILMRLPMKGKIASLNAAVAGSTALYLAWQAREYR
jgi:tRNA(Leu) C34 or U34 (ribose-2'-O)-methylase TrmL